MAWYDYVRIALYALWFVIPLLVVKLLATRKRWRQPLRGNGPMLWALLLMVVASEVARARNIAAGQRTPPPYLPSLVIITAATFLILYWLWRQMELVPRWLRRHLPWRRTRADYTTEEHDHASKPR